MKLIARFLLLACSFLLVFACSKEKQTPQQVTFNQAFSEYISAYTNQEVSKNSAITVRFTQDIQSKEQLNTPIDNSLIKITPTIEGQLTWIDANTLQLKPDQALNSNTNYLVSLALQDIIKTVPDSLAEFQFTFNTIQQQIQVKHEGLAPEQQNQLEAQVLKGEVITTDSESLDDIKKSVSFKDLPSDAAVKWTDNGNGKVFSFEISGIKRNKKTSKFVLSMNAAKIGGQQKEEIEIKVPSIEDFSIQTIKRPETNQIEIQFSDPLSKAQAIKGLVQIKGENNTTHPYTFDIVKNSLILYPQQTLIGKKTVTVSNSIKNIGNYSLKENSSQEIHFTEIKPAIKLVDNGVIVPNTGKVPFAFEAVNLNKVDIQIIEIAEKNIHQFLKTNAIDNSYNLRRVGEIVTRNTVTLPKTEDLKSWNRHVIDLSKYVNLAPGSIYQVALTFRPQYSLYSCEESSENLDNLDVFAREYSWLDYKEDIISKEQKAFNWEYYTKSRYQYYSYRERKNPCHNAYYYRGNNIIKKNILASSLGLIAKKGDADQINVYVSDINTLTTKSGVTIKVYNHQNRLLGTTQTNNEGEAIIKDLKGEPFLVIAEEGKLRGYLSLDANMDQDVSRFNINGVKRKYGVDGYIYTERGVWRPGDQIFTTFMLHDPNNTIPSDHPVGFELIDPKGTLVKRTVIKDNKAGVYTFQPSTEQDAPTGNYRLNVYVAGNTFTKSLRVETIKPNRLKINFEAGDIIKPNQQSGTLSAKWLHGAIAPGLKAKVDVTLKSGKTTFDAFEGYTFDDPKYKISSEETTIFENKLNELGEAEIPLDLDYDNIAPGRLNAQFKVKVFEPGGDFSVDRVTIPYSPYEKYVGIHIPSIKGRYDYLKTNQNETVHLACVNEDGKAISGEKIQIKLYKISWHWWWHSRENNSYHYNGKMYNKPVQEATVTTKSNGRADWNIKLPDNKSGRYLIRAIHPDGHVTGQIVYFDWGWGQSGNDLEKGGAKLLSIQKGKEAYNVGETVNIQFPSTYEGKALVTIESGDKVLKSEWITTQKGTTTYQFDAVENMAPNCYVHVTALQKHADRNIDLPLRMYGIADIKITNPKQLLTPEITLNKVLEPNSTNSISIKEAKGQAMTYTIAIVDEGLLDLTRFKTPKPYDHFNAKQALTVNTWDMYNYVTTADLSDIQNYLTIGGDGALNKGKKKKANRFKPVVTFLGPFTIGANETGTHKFTMPNYVGSVKAMVVAKQNNKYGSASTIAKVRKPLMVLTTLPRVLTPGDEIDMPVTTFAMEDHIKDVSIQIEANEFVELVNTKKTIRFDKPGEQVVPFRLKVKEKIGIAKVKVLVKSGRESVFENIEIDVRLPNATQVKATTFEVDKNSKNSIDFTSIGIEGTDKVKIELSSLPAINFEKRMQELIRYPYGCIEQTTSSAFPQLFFPQLFDISPSQKDEINHNIEAAINRLTTFQKPSGGFSYWPSSQYVSNWGTNYAGHFLLEAKSNGHYVDEGILKKWKTYQKKKARDWRYNDDADDDVTQAYRLLLLAKANHKDLSSMNKLKASTKLSATAKWYLATAYHIIGQEKTANELLQKASYDVEEYRAHRHTFGSYLRDKAVILYALSTMDKRVDAKSVLTDIADRLSSERWLSTQETAYSLLAIKAFVGNSLKPQNLTADINLNGNNIKQVNTKKSLYQQAITGYQKGSNNTLTVNNSSNQLLFATIITEGVPATDNTEAFSKNISLSVKYYNQNNQEINPNNLQQSTDFYTVIRVKNLSSYKRIDNIALSQMMPSGWEIHNNRMDGKSSSKNYDYQDIRDDRVNTFFSLRANETKTFKTNLNATYVGTYYAPAISVSAMYDNDISAATKGTTVVIEK